MIPPVSKLVLGTATLGLNGSRSEAFDLLDCFLDLGGRIIDTAAVYSDWVPGEARRSESIIGEWRRSRTLPSDLVICTKGAHPPLSDMTHSRLDAASITEDVETSLQRLGVDRLDLFFLHRDDATLRVEQILAALRRLLDGGKIGAVGLSNWTPARLAAAREAAIVPIASNQVLGNILCRHMSPPADQTVVRLDGAALQDAEATDTSLFLFSSQCGGFLSKLLAGPSAGPEEYRNPASVSAARKILEIAAGMGADPTNLAVRFLLQVSPNIFPIIGARTLAQLRHSMEATTLHLDPGAATELAAISGFSDWCKSPPGP